MAILVVAMGVMTVFALFPQALDAGRRSTEAGEVACFASYVFTAIEANTNSWSLDDFDGMSITMTHAVDGILDNSQPRIKEREANDPGYFPWIPFWYGDQGGAFWAIEKYEVASFTYTLEYGDGPASQTKYVRLEVWPGDKRDQVKTGKFRRGTVFYREYATPL